MMRSPFITLILLLTLGMSASAYPSLQKPLAQAPATARKLLSISVMGSQRFGEADVVTASGLQLGTPATDEDFKKATRRLGDTGAFTDVAFSYTYTFEGTKLQFHVTDATKFVPAHFEDFVWFSGDDLRQQIKEHVPLFNGELPLSGNMADQVSDVLQAMLVEKGVPGHVGYERAGKTDGPVEFIDYKVSEVLIRIRKINFTGSGAQELPALKQAGRKMIDVEYSRTRLQRFAQRDLLPVYQARGYLKASFGPPQPTAVVQPSAETLQEGPRNQTVVDVTFAVTPGEQYKLKSLTWSGNHEFSTYTLKKMIDLQPGRPADAVRLADELKQIQKLYGTQGFVTATLRTEAQFDDSAATVNFLIAVTEGFAYHMGDLEFRGLDNSLTAKLREAWKLRPGDIYNASYLDEYLPEAQKLLPSNFDWDVASHVTANVRDKTVDVDLIYTVKAPK